MLLAAVRAEAADLRRRLGAVEALLGEWEGYPDGSEHRVAARWLRAALGDTAVTSEGPT